MNGTRIEAPGVRERDVFHSFARALCPGCGEIVDGGRILRGDRVFLRKSCPRCGPSEALVSSDRDWFLRSLTAIKPGSRPLSFSRRVDAGCPRDCGLCEDHEQHTCLPIIEITDHCDLDCPICLVENQGRYRMDRTTFGAIIDGLVAREGTLDTITISGGEPTSHPDLLALLDLARRPEIARVSLSTNGLRLARDEALCAELASRSIYVNLQLDALDDAALHPLRGKGVHAATRLRALDNLERAGARTTLVCTVTRGVNDDRVGEVVRLFLARDALLSLMFQPAAYTGTGSRFLPHDPLDVVTIPEVIARIEKGTDGALRKSDFLPLPCSHPSCFALTYLLKTDDGYVPFPRFLDIATYLDLLTNRGAMRPDARFEGAIRGCIDELWSSAGQWPDRESVLATLKRALRLLYPEDRARAEGERLRLGEGLVKTIFIHAFMDAHTFDLERVKKCCTHYALPDGRLMPACVHNNLYRSRRGTSPRPTHDGTPAPREAGAR